MVIVKKNLSEQIYDSLKQDILDQKIGFGEKLINRGLQEKYGVSSTPVRDAINRLYVDGLLDNISNVGARVIPFDAKVAMEINEIVSLLNRNAVALAASKPDAERVVATLEGCIAQQLENVGCDKYFEFDRQFHHAFFEHSGNSYFVRLYDHYSVLWELLVMYCSRAMESSRANSIAQHRQIADAFKAGDIVQAQLGLERHFQEAVQPLTNAFDTSVMQG